MLKRVVTEAEWQLGTMRVYVRAPTLHIENVVLPAGAVRVEYESRDGTRYEFIRER